MTRRWILRSGLHKTRRDLVSCRHPVLPRFAGPDIDALAVVHFDFDRLVTAVTAYIKTHVVTFFAQFAHRFVRNAALDFNVAAGFRHFFSGRFVVALMLPAREVARYLNI